MMALFLLEENDNDKFNIVISNGEVLWLNKDFLNQLVNIANIGFTEDELNELTQVVKLGLRMGRATKTAYENESRGFLNNYSEEEIEALTVDEIQTLFHNWLRQCSESDNLVIEHNDSIIVAVNLIEPLVKAIYQNRGTSLCFSLNQLKKHDIIHMDISDIADKTLLIQYLSSIGRDEKMDKFIDKDKLSHQTKQLLIKHGISDARLSQ